MSPKKMGKAILCRLLENQIKKLRQKNNFKLIAVAGSAGKTSTKLAIVDVLSGSRKVISQTGNYNDRLTVPLVLFGKEEPDIFNVFAWLRILASNKRALRKPYPYDVAVIEIGTDAPGQLRDFAYLQPDLTVITAVAAEHMEYFGTLDAVASEELTPLDYSKQSLLNLDDIPKKYWPGTSYIGYGQDGDYRISEAKAMGLTGQELSIALKNGDNVKAKVGALGKQGAKITLAAVAVADIIGVSKYDIEKNTASIKPVPGRTQLLKGKSNSILIDDTYNAAPLAMSAALEVLEAAEAPQRIAILGSMNELGSASEAAHREIGGKCDPAKLDWVVTIGRPAGDYLAPAAQAKGCKVESFNNPYEAGHFVAEHLRQGAVVLAKGSQNGVFAEEALKELLANPDDADKLVRQSDYWLKKKQKAFGKPKATEPV